MRIAVWISGLIPWLAISLAACSSDDKDGGSGNDAGKSGAGGGTVAGSPGGGSSGDSGGSAGSGVGGHAGGGAAGRGGGAGGRAGGAGGRGGSGSAGDPSEGGGGDTGPAPGPNWVNSTGNLANMQSECGNLTLLSAVPNAGIVIAGVAKGGLFATDDGGAHWNPLGTGAGSAVITNRPSSIVYDPDDADTFWESGIYNGPGLFKTTDAGQTFEQVGDITHNDLVSIDFTDPERKTLLVGGHEQKQTLYLSTDGGENFAQIGPKLPADSHFSSAPLVVDSQHFFLGACGYGDGTCGVYASKDGGDSWDLASDVAAAARPLWASDDSIYWSTIYDSGIARGPDAGAAWSKVADNLATTYPVELPDGRIMTLRGDHVVVSADQGATWDPILDTLPFKAAGVVYSAKEKTVFVWQWDCGNIVLPNAIASAGFDYTTD